MGKRRSLRFVQIFPPLFVAFSLFALSSTSRSLAQQPEPSPSPESSPQPETQPASEGAEEGESAIEPSSNSEPVLSSYPTFTEEREGQDPSSPTTTTPCNPLAAISGDLYELCVLATETADDLVEFVEEVMTGICGPDWKTTLVACAQEETGPFLITVDQLMTNLCGPDWKFATTLVACAQEKAEPIVQLIAELVDTVMVSLCGSDWQTTVVTCVQERADDPGVEADVWLLVLIADSLLHGDCDPFADDPGRSGNFVRGWGGFICEKRHALVSATTCIHVRISGVWHKLHPCQVRQFPDSDGAAAEARVGCIEGSYYYRTFAKGFAANEQGEVVHSGSARSDRVAIACLVL
ncbi:MAG: hypothetical protein ACRDH6_02835 [Actinomycetota bacterium]